MLHSYLSRWESISAGVLDIAVYIALKDLALSVKLTCLPNDTQLFGYHLLLVEEICERDFLTVTDTSQQWIVLPVTPVQATVRLPLFQSVLSPRVSRGQGLIASRRQTTLHPGALQVSIHLLTHGSNIWQ